MTEDKKTKYAIKTTVSVSAKVEGVYGTSQIVSTERTNETEEIDAIPAAAFHAAKEAVQGALIGMGTNPARIGLSLPGMLEEPEALPEPREEIQWLPEGWVSTLRDASDLARLHGHGETAGNLETLLTALRRMEGIPQEAETADGLEEQDDPDEFEPDGEEDA